MKEENVPAFPCTMCGACCRRVGRVLEELEEAGVVFPYKVDQNGACEMLGEGNRCLVYEDRPEVCRMDYGAGLAGIEREEYYRLTAGVCNSFQIEDGLGEEWRVGN